MKADKAWNFLKDKAFSQSKSDKISGMGRESVRILEKTVLFLSLKVTKIPEMAEKAMKLKENQCFSQSKSDKNSENGRESKEILERQGFLSLQV